MKRVILVFPFLLNPFKSFSCTTCNSELQKAIFDSTFYPNLLMMLAAFIILGIVVALLSYFSSKKEKKRHLAGMRKVTIVPLISAATTLGIAFGGFIDGIFFHQILQWHEMLSNKIPPVSLLNKSVNMFWDGIFHVFCLVVALIGLFLLLNLFARKDVIVTKTAFTGGLLLGWGIFNIVEGIIDHHILKLHNVREITANILMWNYGFLLLAVLLIILGRLLIKKGTPV